MADQKSTMTIAEYQEALGRLFIQASADLVTVMTKLPAQGDRSREVQHREYQKLSVLVENLRGALEKLSGA